MQETVLRCSSSDVRIRNWHACPAGISMFLSVLSNLFLVEEANSRECMHSRPAQLYTKTEAFMKVHQLCLSLVFQLCALLLSFHPTTRLAVVGGQQVLHAT
jgi:hypothetical protein